MSCNEILISSTPLSVFSSVPSCIPLTETDISLVTADFSVGGLIVAILMGHYSNVLGRKNAMLSSTVLMLFSPLILSFSKNLAMLVIGRLFAGIVSGGSTILVPMYLNEISPNELRGVLGSLSQISVITGLLIGALCGNYWVSPHNWRICVGALLLPVLFRLICIPLLVESPKFLASSSTTEKAMLALKRLRAKTNDVSLLQEIDSWEHVTHHAIMREGTTDHHPIGVFAFLKDPIYRHSLILICL